MYIKNTTFLILGMQKSGISATNFLLSKGGKVFVYDDGVSESVKKNLKEAEYNGAVICLDPLEKIESVDVLVLSPAVPVDHKVAVRAKELNKRIIGEFELASNYTKQSLPGVGISIGFSRLFYQLKAAGIISNNGKATPSKIMLVPMDGTLDFTLSAASKLRAQGINTEVYLNSGKMGKKFTYANKLGIPFVGVIGDEEMAQNSVMLKDMVTGEQKLVAVENISSEINA